MKIFILFFLSLSLVACGNDIPEGSINDLNEKFICVAGTTKSYYVNRIDGLRIVLDRIPEGDIFCQK